MGLIGSFLAWTNLSMLIIVFLFVLEFYDRLVYGKKNMKEGIFYKIYNGITFSWVSVLLSVCFLGVIFYNLFLIREMPPEGASPFVSFYMFFIFTHLRSYVIYAGVVFYLWHKWNSLVPALYAGWFGIGAIELTFILQHYLEFNTFIGLSWYLPFIVLMIPCLLDLKKYRFNWKIYLTFGIGVLLEYVDLIWYGQGFTLFINGEIVENLPYVLNPTVGTWIYESMPILFKLLMAAAFCFLDFKKEKTGDLS